MYFLRFRGSGKENPLRPRSGCKLMGRRKKSKQSSGRRGLKAVRIWRLSALRVWVLEKHFAHTCSRYYAVVAVACSRDIYACAGSGEARILELQLKMLNVRTIIQSLLFDTWNMHGTTEQHLQNIDYFGIVYHSFDGQCISQLTPCISIPTSHFPYLALC